MNEHRMQTRRLISLFKPVDFGQLLEDLVDKHDASYIDLAHVTGISETKLRDIKLGKNSDSELNKVVALLDCYLRVTGKTRLPLYDEIGKT